MYINASLAPDVASKSCSSSRNVKESYLGKIRYFETKSYFDSHGLVFEKIAKGW